MDIEKKLLRINKSDYGSEYRNHYLEQYKIYVDMADKVSSRRQSANSFFLSVNTAIIAVIGYVQLGEKAGETRELYWFVSIAGMLLCYSWYRLIRSYKDLNTGKFKVIHSIENNLPLSPFDAEWEALGKGENSRLYHPFTKIEMKTPWVFLFLHLSVLLQTFPLDVFINYLNTFIK